MASFDWQQFLNAHGVPYVARGKNVAKGHINISCPFCDADGDPDPSEHMGLCLKDGCWGCFRNARHRGVKPVRLVRQLLGCSTAEALAVIEDRPTPVGFDSLRERLALLDREPVEAAALPVVTLPRNFKRLARNGARNRFWRYMSGRGWSDRELLKASAYYNLRCSLGGRYKYRVIFPLDYEGLTVGWTGRLVVPSKRAPRYLSHPDGSTIRRTVFNHGWASEGGEVLVICEGPIDAAKIDWYGRGSGIRAVALLGINATAAQTSVLLTLAELYDSVLIMLDAGATQNARRLGEQLAPLRPIVGRWPDHITAGDPGDLRPDEVVPTVSSMVGDRISSPKNPAHAP